jgi:cytochrome c-type biogenesis protein CcmE
MLQIRIYMRSCVTSVKRMMLCLCFISAVLFLMLYVIENTQLKLKLLESVKENARILRIGRRFEQELKERNDNTQILPALYAEAQGVNTSTQLNRCRANVRPKVYVVCNGPFGFVRAPLFHARVVA